MSFDLLAPYYRGMELICAGEKMHRCRTAFLDEISTAQNILLLGEGPGRSLVECRRKFPHAQITCLDASSRMLAEARKRLRRVDLQLTRVQFVHTDILDWIPGAADYDLVVANFFLDCFPAEQLERIISKIALATKPEANWLIADFQTSATGWKGIRSRMILWSLYRFFRVTTRLPAKELTTPDPYLQQVGFRLQRRIQADWNLLHSDWWQRDKLSRVTLRNHRSQLGQTSGVFRS